MGGEDLVNGERSTVALPRWGGCQPLEDQRLRKQVHPACSPTCRLPSESMAVATVGLVRPPRAMDASGVGQGESEQGFDVGKRGAPMTGLESAEMPEQGRILAARGSFSGETFSHDSIPRSDCSSYLIRRCRCPQAGPARCGRGRAAMRRCRLSGSLRQPKAGGATSTAPPPARRSGDAAASGRSGAGRRDAAPWHSPCGSRSRSADTAGRRRPFPHPGPPWRQSTRR